MYVSVLNLFPCLFIFIQKLIQISPKEKFPVLHRWMTVMVEEVEAVQSTLLPFDVHVELVKALTKHRPMDYSLADTTGQGVTVYAAPPN